jgi:hypothetical protein
MPLVGLQNGECCLAVLDKIVVFSTDGGKHMHDVERATKKLKKAEMTVDLHRSGFGFSWEGLVKLLREESAHAKLIKLADDPNAQTEAADAGPSTKGNENEGACLLIIQQAGCRGFYCFACTSIR